MAPTKLPNDDELRSAALRILAQSKVARSPSKPKTDASSSHSAVDPAREDSAGFIMDPVALCKALRATNPDWLVKKGKVQRVLKRINSDLRDGKLRVEWVSLLEQQGAPECAGEPFDVITDSDFNAAEDMSLGSASSEQEKKQRSEKAMRQAHFRRLVKERKRALDMAMASVGVEDLGSDPVFNEWIVVGHAVDCLA